MCDNFLLIETKLIKMLSPIQIRLKLPDSNPTKLIMILFGEWCALCGIKSSRTVSALANGGKTI